MDGSKEKLKKKRDYNEDPPFEIKTSLAYLFLTKPST